ncbi:MAG: hypothetical protein WKF30_18920 [Pyrinomonadaceae bacterium]
MGVIILTLCVGINRAQADTVVLTFEGVGDLNPVGDFYNAELAQPGHQFFPKCPGELTPTTTAAAILAASRLL